MEVTRAYPWIGLALIASAFVGCGVRRDAADLPTTRETLQAIGRRLSRSHSERELTAHRIPGGTRARSAQPG